MSADPQQKRARPCGAVVGALALLLGALFVATPGLAQPPLACGVPVSGTLGAGGVQTYALSTAPGATVFIQTSDISGTIGLVRMRLTGPGGTEILDTCSGIAKFSGRAGVLQLQVSACNGSGVGTFTTSLNVVSDGAGSCGRAVVCGATPEGVGLELPGEVDALLLSLEAGRRAIVRVNYTSAAGAPALRLFDPDGVEVSLPSRCAGTITIDPGTTGIYTALVAACSRPISADYRLEFFDDLCPVGPAVTHFGVANASNDPQRPIGFDPVGRPVFNQPFGQGFSLVVEARAGANRRNPGRFSGPYFVDGELRPPDLQMILSRPLGDGSPVICDTAMPDLGGVPATVPFAYPSAPAIVEDFGCRFVDGSGELIARTSSPEACTRSDAGFGFGFVDRGSNLQFCGGIASAWRFPEGDTIVAARIADGTEQALGAARELVVRVGDATPRTASPSATPTATPTRSPSRPPTATATASRTRTATPTATNTPANTVRSTATATRTRTETRTATATATGPTPDGPTSTATATPPVAACAGDCSGDGVVSIDELTRVIAIVLGSAPLEDCPPADALGDGALSVLDVIAAVRHSLRGCP